MHAGSSILDDFEKERHSLIIHWWRKDGRWVALLLSNLVFHFLLTLLSYQIMSLSKVWWELSQLCVEVIYSFDFLRLSLLLQLEFVEGVPLLHRQPVLLEPANSVERGEIGNWNAIDVFLASSRGLLIPLSCLLVFPLQGRLLFYPSVQLLRFDHELSGSQSEVWFELSLLGLLGRILQSLNVCPDLNLPLSGWVHFVLEDLDLSVSIFVQVAELVTRSANYCLVVVVRSSQASLASMEAAICGKQAVALAIDDFTDLVLERH